MTAPMKISACVDCGTTIIGERLRCPACHEDHAADLLESSDAGEVTIARDSVEKLLIWQVLLAWFVLAQFITIGMILLILSGRGC